MALIVYDLALQMLRHIKPIIDKVARHDRNLADHMQRSAQQSFLNLAEASSARGRNEVAKFRLHPGGSEGAEDRNSPTHSARPGKPGRRWRQPWPGATSPRRRRGSRTRTWTAWAGCSGA